MKKDILTGILFLKKKDKRPQKKKLDCKFINTSKENYVDYEIGRIQTFISKFKNKKLRELEKENKELKEKIIKVGKKD